MPVDFGQNDISAGTVEAVSKPFQVTPLADFGENDISEGSAVPRNLNREDLTADPRTLGVSEGFLQGFSSDEQERLNIAAKAIFPDMPVSESAKRFGMTRDRTMFFMDDQGQPVPVENSTMGGLARATVESSPMLAGTAAGIVTAPLATTGIGLVGTVAATGGTAAAVEAGRQALGDYLLGDRSTNDIDELAVAREGVLAGAGQGVGVGIGQIAQRSQVGDIGRLNRPQATRAFKEANRHGIKITPGQATGLRSLQGQEKRLATRIPETVDEMDNFLRQQGDDVVTAFRNQLDDISPRFDAEEVGRSVRSAAQNALDDVKKVRSARAAPLYDEAFDASGPIPLDDVLKTIDDQLQTVPETGAMATALKTVRRFLTDANGKPVQDLQRLHNARVELRNIIDTRKAGDSSLNNTIIGKLGDVKTSLTRAMDAGSAKNANGESIYKLARETFSEVSGDVDDAFSSALGRIANIKDDQVLSVVRQAFSGTTRSPQMVGRLRVALEKQDPQAWQALKRVWLDDAVGAALKQSQSGQVINPAGKILGVLNDPKMAGNLKAALTKPETKALNNLKTTLGRIAKFNIGGSDTATNLAADKAALDQATPLYAKATKLLQVWKLPDMLAASRGEANMRRQAQQMLELVTSGDEAALDGLSALRQITPQGWRALSATGQLGTQGAVAGGAAALD